MHRSSEETERVEQAEQQRWRGFYSDRTRSCPFFVNEPDENLVEWIESGRIQRGGALDIGCGNGRNAYYLARHGFQVIGVDLSEQAIAWAREGVAQAAGQVSFECRSIFDHALQAQGLDFIYDSGCFHHLPPHKREAYARLVAGALRPGCQFGLVCFAPEGGSGQTDEQVYERGTLAGGLGYSDDELRDFWSRHLEVTDLRRMREVPAGSGCFGRSFLWVLLARAG
jgi:SAM-dependent methyltransferase